MQDEIIRLQRELEKTMIFITHDLAEALKLGDARDLMQAGELVQSAPEELVAQPADRYVADFIRDVPRAHAPRAHRRRPRSSGNGQSYSNEIAQHRDPRPVAARRELGLPLRVTEADVTIGGGRTAARRPLMLEADS